MLGSGDGSFGPPRSFDAGDNPVGVTIADVDHDTRQDLVAASFNEDSVEILAGRGDGTFGARRAPT